MDKDDGSVVQWADGVDPNTVDPSLLVKLGPNKWKACFKHPEIVCRNEQECFAFGNGKTICSEDPHERLTPTTEIRDMSDFHKGARAFYDSLIAKASGRYHGNPDVQKSIDAENKIIYEWAEEALLEVSPNSYNKWKSLNQMYEDGREQGRLEERQEDERSTPGVVPRDYHDEECSRMKALSIVYAVLTIVIATACIVRYNVAEMPLGSSLFVSVFVILLGACSIISGRRSRLVKKPQRPPRLSPPAQAPNETIC